MHEASPRGGVHWATLVYYYLAALIGLVTMIVGAIVFVSALVAGEAEVSLGGLLSGAVGAPVFLWHLREARRREGL